jgi:hypothetical protein
MFTPKIILLKLLPSLIISAAILLGLFVLAKKVETTLETTINAYLQKVQLLESNRNNEIDLKIAKFGRLAEAIARGSRFQYAIYENKDDAYSSSPTHYLFDSLNGEVIKGGKYGTWTVPRVPMIIFSSDLDESDWVKYVNRTETNEFMRWRRDTWLH